ncbi:hypothetical protein BGZ46_009698, partial [Entomortierella lignicola]
MVQARRFHSNFLFCIPLTQGVLLTIILEFCKNAAFFAHQVQNMNPNSIAIIGNGEQVEKPKDPAYMAAQYIYGIWMIMMMINAIIGFRANLKFNLRWMSIFNILFGIDTGFEFIHTTLGVIFQDTSQLNDSAIIQTYCLSYVIMDSRRDATIADSTSGNFLSNDGANSPTSLKRQFNNNISRSYDNSRSGPR